MSIKIENTPQQSAGSSKAVWSAVSDWLAWDDANGFQIRTPHFPARVGYERFQTILAIPAAMLIDVRHCSTRCESHRWPFVHVKKFG